MKHNFIYILSFSTLHPPPPLPSVTFWLHTSLWSRVSMSSIFWYIINWVVLILPQNCVLLYDINWISISYVYWTVHHLDIWVKRDQLDVSCFIISLFNAQHVSDVNTSILRSGRLICWVISWVVLLWFDTTPPQPNHNVTPAHIEPEQ